MNTFILLAEKDPTQTHSAFLPEGYSTQHGKLMGRHSATLGRAITSTPVSKRS